MPQAVLDPCTADALRAVQSLLHQGQVAEALTAAQDIWQRLEGGDELQGQAECMRLFAAIHQVAGRLPESVRDGYRAISLYQRVDAPAWLARTLTMQAVALARHGDSSEALRLVTQAIALLERDVAPPLAAAVWNNISVVYEALGQLGNAVNALDQAIALTRDGGDPHFENICICNLSLYRLAQAQAAGETPTRIAVEALRRHMDRCEADGRDPMVASMAERTGTGLAEIGELDDAKRVFAQGLRCAERAGLGPERARLLVGLAQAERLAGQHAQAESHLQDALVLAQQGDEQEVLAACHLEHSRLLESRGGWEEALASYKRYAAVREAMLQARAALAVEAVSARMTAERVQLEAQLLQNENAALERSVEELAAETTQLKQDAEVDPLTGLGNRRHFHRRVHELRAEAARAGHQEVVVLQSDIDHFKRINDTWSHAMGDRVLQEIGALLRHHCRPYDVVARFGGEEFVVAFGGATTLAQAISAAERLRQNIANHPWHTLHPELRVTLSLGIAPVREGESTDSALQRADEALYEAKRSGRNRLCCAN
jgi:diguanylate cyclase (GGDEF)-like protein